MEKINEIYTNANTNETSELPDIPPIHASSTPCKDYEDSMDYFTWARVEQGTEIYEDVCLKSGELDEVYCDGLSVRHILYKCGSGCMNGQCIDAKGSIWIDNEERDIGGMPTMVNDINLGGYRTCNLMVNGSQVILEETPIRIGIVDVTLIDVRQTNKPMCKIKVTEPDEIQQAENYTYEPKCQCDDNNPCTEDTCMDKGCIHVSNGCFESGACLPDGTIADSRYCSDGSMQSRKQPKSTCGNDYECLSNVCKNNLCSGNGFVSGFLTWLMGLFS
jgi:hypothetical protein